MDDCRSGMSELREGGACVWSVMGERGRHVCDGGRGFVRGDGNCLLSCMQCVR